jgi:aminomethyltransferase
MSATVATPLARTPLHEIHVRLGARLVPFAGTELPVHYPSGIIAEHLHTRAEAGLFDVSHMGQAILSGKSAAALLETLVPGDIAGLANGQMRYTQLLDAEGHILDDLMVTRLSAAPDGSERLFLVVNGAVKEQDFALISKSLPQLQLAIQKRRALIAIQGPKAVEAVARHFPEVRNMAFMTMKVIEHGELLFYVSRSGYTGEDGVEISVPAGAARAFVEELLEAPEIKPIGLGARDSLRLEAGLCLYGHDIDTTTNPVEAGLLWSISKRRRTEGGFPGAAHIQNIIAEGPARKRVGILLEGKAPAREGAEITSPSGEPLGKVTSGGFAPSLGRPIAMGYVAASHAAPGNKIHLIVRGKALAAEVVALPFVPHRYFRG